MLRLKQP